MAIGRTDLRLSYDYDLMIRIDNDQADLMKTNVNEIHCLSQALYFCLKTDKGQFSLRPTFGASATKYLGEFLTPELIKNIEQHVQINLQSSMLLDSSTRIQVKAAPLTKELIAIRVYVIIGGLARPLKVDMMFSSKENTISPVSNLFGGQIG
jgi:phage baseplate assembly protein W